ncbi:MAG TPA: hypothetical protein VNZ94_00915 [Xanthobacteraceae bacterium]|nr:hypothetical protein [Xanthobacteraceae bacterium]
MRGSFADRTEQIEPLPIDAANVAAPDRHSMPIEKFEDLDGDLAAIVHAIAELSNT